MRRWILAWILIFLAGGTLPTDGQTAKPKQESTRSGPGRKRLRFIVPGVGGAIPPREKPSGPPVPPQPPFGPLNPNLPGQGPAPVVVPKSFGTPLPGLPQTGSGIFPALQARPVSRFLYGANVAWGDMLKDEGGAKARRLAQLIKGAGVTNTRIGINWADVERVRGTYDWRATDRFVRFVANLGVTPICVVATTPDWALDSSPETRKLFRDRGVAHLADGRAPDPMYYADLGRFAYACAQRYKKFIKHWEFWNEPDGRGMPTVVKNAAGQPTDIRYDGDPKVYTQLLTVFSRNVKRADPAARVAVGGLQAQQTDFLAGIYAHGGRPYFDAVALHPYNDRGPLAFGWIDKCRDLMVKKGDAAKTFWLTEWGWATSPGQRDGVSELHQARLVRESLAAMRFRPFITQASYHTLNDWRTNENDPTTLVARGLCARDLRPRPAYFVFREMATGLPAEGPRRYRRIALIGDLPTTEEGGVRGASVGVTVDADRPGEPLPPLWEGYAQGYQGTSPAFLEDAVNRLKALNARLIRFDPFPNPEAIKTLAAEGDTSQRIVLPNTPTLADPDSRSQSPAFSFDWRYSDAMVDAIARAGAKPMMNFATMPTALSAPVGNAALPHDPTQWSDFVKAVVSRYNREQKRGIVYWELSHEPNTGTFALAEWLRFYETFARAVTAADPNAKVGGPAVGGFDTVWLKALADYCAQNSVPLHFLTWHAYDQPPAEYARQISEMREYLRRYPQFKDVELIVGEWNVSARQSPENDGLFAAAHALSVVEALMSVPPVRALYYEVKEGPDIRQSDAPFTGRWGLLTKDGQPKAAYNAFKMLSRMAGARLPTESEETEIHALASRSKEKVSILLWRYPRTPHALESVGSRESAVAVSAQNAFGTTPDTRHPTPDIPVRLQVRGLPWTSGTRGAQWVVDARHGNAFGNPVAAELRPATAFRAPGGDLEIPVVLAPYAATLIELSPAGPSSLEVTAETPRFVVYGGSLYTIAARVRNTGAKPLTIAPTLSSSDPSLVSAPKAFGARSQPETIAPGEAKTFRFTLRAPLGRPEGQEFFQIRCSGVQASRRLGPSRTPEVAAGVSVKFVTPISVRIEPARVDLLRPDAPPDSLGATAQFRAVVENRADAPVRVGLASGKASVAVTVPGRSIADTPVSVVKPGAGPGNYDMPVRVALGGRTVTTLNAVVGVPALCKYAARKPRVNGDLSEWMAAYPIALDSATQVKEKDWGGAADLSAQALTMWDAENFYLAVTVTDDTHFQPLPPENLWRADSVQFALDTRRDARLDQIGYGEDDCEFGLASGSSGALAYRFQGAFGKPSGVVKAVAVAVRRVGNRTIYEAAIPWSELVPRRPVGGALLGFSLLVNDSDGQGRGYIEWAGGMGDVKRPGRFIGLRLVK